LLHTLLLFEDALIVNAIFEDALIVNTADHNSVVNNAEIAGKELRQHRLEKWTGGEDHFWYEERGRYLGRTREEKKDKTRKSRRLRRSRERGKSREK